MPPRYAYWTIIVDDQPTAFRSGSQEELMPTFKRLKAKNHTAVMRWFQNGKLWASRIDAQEMMRARGEMGRRGDERQAGFRSKNRDRPSGDRGTRSAWTPRGEPSTPPPARNVDDKLDWKPKGEFIPAPKRSERPDWKPKGAFTPAPRPRTPEKRGWKPASDWGSKSGDRAFKPSRPQDLKASRPDKPEWKPKGEFTAAPRSQSSGKREWKPKSDWGSKSGDRAFTSSRPQELKALRPEKPEWKPKGSLDRERRPAPRTSSDREERPRSFTRPAFKPSGDESRTAKPEWKPKGSFNRERKPDWKPRERGAGPGGSQSARPEWKPKGDGRSEASAKRKWVPKEEYKKSIGVEAARDSKWRPGGEHKDPRQKYKDAKKAKWTKFKQNIRARSGGKGKKSS